MQKDAIMVSKKSKMANLEKIISFLLLTFCVAFVSIKAYECFEKYLKKPKAVDISHNFIGDTTFPSMTICPNPTSKPDPIKVIEIEKCKLSVANYKKDFIWVNNDTDLPAFCRNPKDLHIKIMKKITEMKISQIQFKNFDIKIRSVFKIDELNWTMVSNNKKRRCYSLEIPQDILKKGIQRIIINTQPQPKVELSFSALLKIVYVCARL